MENNGTAYDSSRVELEEETDVIITNRPISLM